MHTLSGPRSADLLRIHADFLDNRERVSREKRWSCFASQFICSLAELDGFSDLAELVGMKDEIDHWRELPQVSFLSRQSVCVFLATKVCLSIIGGSCHKYHFCRDKGLSPKDCRDKHVFCGDKSMFVATNVFLSRQAYFCRDKHVTNQTCLSRQNVCRDKNYICGSSCQ